MVFSLHDETNVKSLAVHTEKLDRRDLSDTTGITDQACPTRGVHPGYFTLTLHNSSTQRKLEYQKSIQTFIIH